MAGQIRFVPLRSVSPQERRRRLREREKWLKGIDLLEAFNSLFDLMPEYRVFLKRRPGEIMFLSRAMLQTLHISDEASVIGVTDFELTPGPLAHLYQQRDEMVIRTGKPLIGAMEVWFTQEGLPQWFTCYKLPLKDPTGKIVGIIGFLKEYKQVGSLPVNEPLNTILSYIDANLSSPISVQELAKMAMISRRHLERLFRDTLGLTPKQYLIKKRTHEAARLLTETDLPLSRIALEVGFCDQSALNFYFRRELGITPLKFRRAATIWKENSTSRQPHQSILKTERDF